MCRAGSDRGRGGLISALLVSALLALTGAPGPAEGRPRPRPFRVEGIPTALVIRQAPRPDSPRVGEIPAAARGIVASGRRQRLGRTLWHEVQYQGVRGWVDAPTLARHRARPLPPGGAPAGGGVFMEDLVCQGRAPDWKLVIDRDGTVACSAGCTGPAQLRALPAQPEKRRGSWRLAIRDGRGHDRMLVSLRYTGQCSDAAGDLYAYRVNTLAVDGTRQSGCCNRLEAPITFTTGP
jgi:hypothetical protein